MTQTKFAEKLNVTRSCVNLWEMGTNTPSMPYIRDVALLFGVSVDYLLDMPQNNTVSVDGLTDREIASIIEIIECYRIKH